jgi:hypothetical protein
MFSRQRINGRARRNLFMIIEQPTYFLVCLVDCAGIWMINNAIIFNLDYRFCGTPDNIYLEMSRNGFSEEQITEIINNSITKDNYQTTKKDEYNRELEQYERHVEVGFP